MLMTGLLAHTSVNGANTTGNGLFFGETALFFTHLKALVIVFAYTFVGSLIILKITDLISPLHVNSVKPKAVVEEEKVFGDLSPVNAK